MYMERITVVLVVLVILNLLPSTFVAFDDGKESTETLEAKIVAMEKEFQDFEELASWTSDAQSALDPPPEENISTYVDRFQGLARAWKFNLQETAQSGNNPVILSFSGVGDYRSFAHLTAEMIRSQAVIPKKIFLAKQDDGLLSARMELNVRFGPWEGEPVKKRTSAIPEPQPPPSLGTVDLFGKHIEEAPQPVQEPAVRYLGYSSGEGKPSGIIEENTKAFVLSQGEKTPGGFIVVTLAPEQVELRNTGGRVWKIPLKKSN
jgi:hypothetical protein